MATAKSHTSGYLLDDAGAIGGARASGGDIAYIAFGDRIEARARPWGSYFQDFELDSHFSTYFQQGRTSRLMPMTFYAKSSGILVQLMGSGAALARAVENVRTSLLLNDALYLSQRSDEGGVAGGVGSSGSAGHVSATVVEHPTGVSLLPDASVQDMATHLSALAGLSDRYLARLFPGEVHRETYQRWRTGKLTNPTPPNRRRLWLLAQFLEELGQRGVAIQQWLQNPTTIDGLTPYELLVDGRLDEAEWLAAAAMTPRRRPEEISNEGRWVTLEESPARFVLRAQEPTVDLVLDEGEGWTELEDEPDVDE